MLMRAALAFGVVFVAAGILGFVPAVAPLAEDGEGALLFGLFAVNGLHNWVHILSGIVALIVGLRSEAASRIYFRWFGVIYGLVAVLGLVVGRGLLLGMAHNMPDVALHLIIAAAALYLGFASLSASHPPGMASSGRT